LQHGRAEVVRLLRAKPDGPWRQFNIYEQTLLFPAARFGDSGIVQDLILRGLDPLQVDDEGRTPLFYAGSRTVVRLLLSKGDDPKRRDKAGATALFTVSDPGAAEALLAAGTPRGVEDEHGRTALDVQKKDHPDVAV